MPVCASAVHPQDASSYVQDQRFSIRNFAYPLSQKLCLDDRMRLRYWWQRGRCEASTNFLTSASPTPEQQQCKAPVRRT